MILISSGPSLPTTVCQEHTVELWHSVTDVGAGFRFSYKLVIGRESLYGNNLQAFTL